MSGTAGDAPSLAHVLWLGGPSGAGKTVIARRMAKRLGLRLYSSDVMTFAHRDRAVALGDAAALRWEGLRATGALKQLAPEDLDVLSLRSQRETMVVEDLARMPRSPLIVAEGGVLPVWVVEREIADASRALWLLPTAAAQGENLVRRGWRGLAAGTSSAFLAQRRLSAESEAANYRVPTLTVDGSTDVAILTARVEDHFAAALAAGPVAASESERRALMREANLAKVDNVRRASRRAWFGSDPDSTEDLFVCECADRDCVTKVACPVGATATAPVMAPGHRP